MPDEQQRGYETTKLAKQFNPQDPMNIKQQSG